MKATSQISAQVEREKPIKADKKVYVSVDYQCRRYRVGAWNRVTKQSWPRQMQIVWNRF